MDEAALFDRVYSGTREFARAVGGAAGASVHELEGVTATVSPNCPERSVVNSVEYDDSGALSAALPALARLYDEAGVDAWTVWVPAQDRETAGLLEDGGHVLDAVPLAMACPIEEAIEPGQGPEDWGREADASVVGPINDRAYGYEGSFTRALEGVPPDAMDVWVARVDGRPSSCIGTIDHGDDRHIVMVATLPEARGRGLASGLLAHALAAGRTDGIRSTSLVATKLGAPVYERLGYRTVGSVEMWERRKR